MKIFKDNNTFCEHFLMLTKRFDKIKKKFSLFNMNMQDSFNIEYPEYPIVITHFTACDNFH